MQQGRVSDAGETDQDDAWPDVTGEPGWEQFQEKFSVRNCVQTKWQFPEKGETVFQGKRIALSLRELRQSKSWRGSAFP
jgi:hypothetical protein